MQIRKFEAPTIQEAIETIKRELGPEAIILQTKRNRGAFGLLSKGSVEVTAAVSEKALQKKSFLDKKLTDDQRITLGGLSADKQREQYDRHLERQLAKQKLAAEPARQPASDASKRSITATRYIDIDDESSARSRAPKAGAIAAGSPTYAPPSAPVRSNISQKDQAAIAAQILRAQASRSAYAAAQAPLAQGTPQNAGVPQSAAAAAALNSQAADLAFESYSSDAPARGLVGAQGETALQEEVRQLKHMLTELKASQEDSPGATALSGLGSLGTPALRDAFEMLVLNGVERRNAYTLVKKVAFELGEENAQSPDAVLDHIAVEIMESTEVLSLFDGIEARSPEGSRREPVVMALVGPTGVGKTTTLAKIASEAVLKRNLKVGLLNVDTYKVAALDQLSTYAQILNVPFRSVADADELNLALQDFQHLDLVLVDTSGRSQKDTDSLREMEKMLHSVPSLRMQLVLSVTTRDQELNDMGKRFSTLFRPEGLILSKLDEAMTFGSVLNASSKLKLPLIYFTTGQRVPQDIEDATKERVASLVMEL